MKNAAFHETDLAYIKMNFIIINDVLKHKKEHFLS